MRPATVVEEMEAFLPKGLLETYDLEQALANERRRVRELEAHVQMLERTIHQNNIAQESAMRHNRRLEETVAWYQHQAHPHLYHQRTPPPYSY